MSSWADRFGNLTVQQALEWNEAVMNSEAKSEMLKASSIIRTIYKSIEVQNKSLKKGTK